MSARVTMTIPEWLDRICAWPVTAYRKHKYGYTYRRINLEEGRWTLLDKEDYYRYNKFNWYIGGHGGKLYAMRTIIAGEDEITTMRMNREIMKAPDDRVVDHRNGDSLDNRRDNLRIATQAENMQNRRKRKNTTSRYIGVWFTKEYKKWESRIRHQGKKIYLGKFRNEIDAARAYDAAAKKYHGEFARLNFPDFKPSMPAQDTKNPPLLEIPCAQAARAEEEKIIKLMSRERNPVRKWLRRAKILKILKMDV
jgi:hypothetical protein